MLVSSHQSPLKHKVLRAENAWAVQSQSTLGERDGERKERKERLEGMFKGGCRPGDCPNLIISCMLLAN